MSQEFTPGQKVEAYDETIQKWCPATYLNPKHEVEIKGYEEPLITTDVRLPQKPRKFYPQQIVQWRYPGCCTLKLGSYVTQIPNGLHKVQYFTKHTSQDLNSNELDQDDVYLNDEDVFD